MPEKYIFISHSSRDGKSVRQLVDFLESAGVRCWVSYRDIPPGADWAETIYDAIAGSAGMVFVFSENSNTSRQIRNELDIATNLGIDIIPVKIENIPSSKGVRYFTNSHQWLDASRGWRGISDKLLQSLGVMLDRDISIPAGKTDGGRYRRLRVAAMLLPVLVLLIIAGVHLLRDRPAAVSTEGLLNLVAGCSDSWDYATDVAASPDGGFTVTGTWDWGFWSEWWVTRFDSSGTPVWTWSDSLAGEDKPLLLAASGGDVISACVGYAGLDHAGFPVRAVRLNSSGGTEWDSEWWLEWEGAVQPELAAFEMNSDSLLFLFFTMRQLSSQSTRANHQVTLSASGGFVRHDTLTGGRTARELIVLENGNILRVGQDISSRANEVEIVSPGGEEVCRTIIGDTRSFVTCGLELPEGDIVLFMTKDTYGPGKGDLSVMRFSPDLRLLRETAYGGRMPEGASDALLLPSGDILVAGHTCSWGDGTRNGWLLMLDEAGEQRWQTIADMGGNDYLTCLTLLQDGRIAAAGATSMHGQPDAWIVQFNPDGSWNRDHCTGLDIFTENWDIGFIDQTAWSMGYNRNYTPVLHRDSVTGNRSFDANNVPVVSTARYPLVPGLSLSVIVTVPDMPGAEGSNWLAAGLTRSGIEDFQLDPGAVTDIELRWTYTKGIHDQGRELRAICISDGSVSAFSDADTLWLARGSGQLLTIEVCTGAVRFLVNDILFHEEPFTFSGGQDSVSIYLWGSSNSLPHNVDNVRLFSRRW